VGGGLRLGTPAGAGALELPLASGATLAPDGEVEEFMELPALAELPSPVLTDPPAEFIALTPGLLGTSEPAGPGTEPATGPELPAPMLAPDPPAPELPAVPAALPPAP